MAEEQQDLMEEEPVQCEHYNPVTIHQQDTIGAIMLGIVAIALLVALLRVLAHNRELLRQLQS